MCIWLARICSDLLGVLRLPLPTTLTRKFIPGTFSVLNITHRCISLPWDGSARRVWEHAVILQSRDKIFHSSLWSLFQRMLYCNDSIAKEFHISSTSNVKRDVHKFKVCCIGWDLTFPPPPPSSCCKIYGQLLKAWLGWQQIVGKRHHSFWQSWILGACNYAHVDVSVR